jgi:hypothetical protein
MTERKATRAIKGASGASNERAVKRSVTVRPDLNDAILESVGARAYSAFVNEALVMALQARGIDETVADFERAHGPLTAAEIKAARRRRAVATGKRG